MPLLDIDSFFKKLITVAILIVLSLQTNGQTDTISGKWSIGLQLFPSSCKSIVTQVDSSIIYSWGSIDPIIVNDNLTSWAPSGAFSLDLGYKLNHKFGIYSGIGYQMVTEANSMRVGIGGDTLRPYYLRHYIQIPLSVGYNIFKRFTIRLGLSTSMFISTTKGFYRRYRTAQGKQWITAEKYIFYREKNPISKQFIASFVASVQYHIIKRDRFKWFVAPRFQYGFSEMVKYHSLSKHYVQYGVSTGVEFLLDHKSR